ncbi:phosphotransferase [Limosilactobacillus sp. Sa3CUN2]|uniref:Phosphotransferase n=1 Tax=Limosilactobacillus avistercoris TaxID=2762243 RepID=A0ABR8PD35_9LACO|nr:phosphotransferase [Limosilactobacillus avistercoris]MBD7895204.1 phosphotransferase [Limosilactobacillus avistercoris]
MNKQLLDLFKLKLKKPQITQRDLASQLNISLGKVNQLLDQLKQNNLFNEELSLTIKGKKYIKNHYPQQAVILAAGFGMRMVPINTEEPKGLLEINGEPLIERLIKQLQAKGIKRIKIVVGFMKEHYEYLIDQYGIELIVNTKYGEWNNLYSLYLAKDYLENSYIVPCDLWFKNNPFSELEDQAWYMFSRQTNSDSNWQVTNRGNIKPVNQDGNRMVGLAYLNNELGKQLKQRLIERVESCDGLNQFWESTLDFHGSVIDANLVDEHEYAEINSYEELRDLDGNSNHLKNDAIDVIEQTLNVPGEAINQIHVLKKGMTNRSFIFSCQGKRYIMRIPGAGTGQLINRHQEYDVYQRIKGLPYVERTLYLNPQNGYKLTEFIENSRNCDPNSWDDVQQCMHLLKQMHQENLKVDHQFDLAGQINKYEQLRSVPSAYRDYGKVKQQVEKLLQYVDSLDKEWTLCHIDANADNFVFDQQGNIFLIDWEYAGMQDPHVDIAMFAIYSMYDQSQIDYLIGLYFEHPVSEDIRYKIYAYVAICGLLWSNWCEYKQSLGLDFGEYSLAQYRYAKEYSQKVLRYLERK